MTAPDRPRHCAGRSRDPAANLGGVGVRHRQRAGIGHRQANLARKPRREQIGLSDRNRGRMSRQAGQHNRGLRRAGVLAAGQPRESGVLQIAPQRFVEGVGKAAMSEARVKRPAAEIVDQLGQFVHRCPRHFAQASSHTHASSHYSAQHLVRPAAQRKKRGVHPPSGHQRTQRLGILDVVQ